MSFTVTVQPSGHQFSCAPEETLLDAALRQGLALPYGCRDGACGACRGRVLDGRIDHGKAQESALPPTERALGQALFCCARPQSDLTIESKEVRRLDDIPIKTLPTRIQSLDKAAPDVMIVRLQLPSSERLQFLAGQYVDILLKDGRRRSFSLANAPHDDACLELHIRYVPGGFFTEQVFSSLKVKDILRLNGPHGSFYLREDCDLPMVMVAGGTGFAPIKAVIEHAIAEGSTRPIHLYWGGRAKADLYLLQLAQSWADTHAHIHFTPVLAQPETEDAWRGRTGLVHQAALADFPDLSGFQAYVCGAPGMITAARQDFCSHAALPEDAFFADSFDFANDGA